MLHAPHQAILLLLQVPELLTLYLFEVARFLRFSKILVEGDRYQNPEEYQLEFQIRVLLLPFATFGCSDNRMTARARHSHGAVLRLSSRFFADQTR